MVSHGLMKRLTSESELAGVLAHEIAHVLKKHQLAAIQSDAGWSAAATGGEDLRGGPDRAQRRRAAA